MRLDEMATKAAFYRFGIESGIVSENEIRDWAFQIIEEMQEPPYEIIELSTCHGFGKLHDALSMVKGSANVQLAGKMLLCRLHKFVSPSAEEIRFVAVNAMKICRSTGLPEEIYYCFDAVEDNLFLAQYDKYGTIEECYQELLEVIKPFEEFVSET
jgi:hypothetical protein